MAEELLTDIERDLARLLAVEPSPEFRPRVRARIDSETRRVRTVWGRAALATAAAVAVMAIAVGLLRSNVDSGVTPPPSPHGGEADVRLASTPSVSRTPDAAAPGARDSRPELHAAEAPVVIVDQAQADAVRRLLVVAATAPRFSPVELPVEPAAPAVSPLSVDPMLIEPVQVPELNKGVQQ